MLKLSRYIQYGDNYKALMIYLNKGNFIPYDRLANLSQDILDIPASQGTLVNNGGSQQVNSLFCDFIVTTFSYNVTVRLSLPSKLTVGCEERTRFFVVPRQI